MLALRELQSVFADALLDAERPLPSDVVSHTAAVPTRRFNVYRNNVVVSLVEALQSTFPVVCRLVGDEFFGAMAKEYALANPPRSPILSRYGSGFPEFLAGFEPVADVPYIADVARLEWLQVRAFHAPDRVALDASRFVDLEPSAIPGLLLELHPSANLFTSMFPSVSIWKTNTHDEEVQAVDLSLGGEDALVVRPQLQTIVLPLPKGGYAFIEALRARKRLSIAFQIASACGPDFDLQYGLAAMIDCGAIVGVCMANDSNQ